jgi:hypothetical protein
MLTFTVMNCYPSSQTPSWRIIPCRLSETAYFAATVPDLEAVCSIRNLGDGDLLSVANN